MTNFNGQTNLETKKKQQQFKNKIQVLLQKGENKYSNGVN